LSDPLVAARALHFASTATFAGLFLFLFLVGEPAFRTGACTTASLRKGFLGIGWISLLLALGSGAAWFLLLAFDLAGRSSDALFSQAILWTLLTETRFGNDALVGLALVALLSICLVRFHLEHGWRSRWDGPAAAVLAACLAGSLAWAGHGSSGSGTPGEFQLGADALHSLAATAWIGGLLPLLLLLAFARREDDEPSLAMAAEASRRFSQFGVLSVSVLLATGIVNTYFLVGSVPGLVGTDYGLLLLAKMTLFAVMVAFAAINRYRELQRLGAGKPRAAVLGRIARNGLIELLLGGVILIIVGTLGTMPPAAHVQAWWPFPLRLSTDALQEPSSRLELAGALAAVTVALFAIVAAIAYRPWRWPVLAAAAVLLTWGGPRLNLLTAEAYPTTFFVSPTGYSAHSVAAGRALFAEHCVSCHGERGRGDGPAAKDLRPLPADLTAEHIYGHSNGDLFWWISHGIGEAMPPFSTVLDEAARWNLIDFVHANADARRWELAEDTSTAARVPEFSVECSDGSDVSISQLRGQIVHLVFAGPQSATRLDQLSVRRASGHTSIAVRLGGLESAPLCSTSDPEVIAAFAIYRGTDAIDGTEFLIDGSGWLRSMWYPGVQPDWRDPGVLAEEIETIVNNPGKPQPTSAHVHAH
jgi:putative copper export protein/mono/diheme cytochrome c family protein